MHRSVAVVRPRDLKKRYYWVCDNCSHFQTKETPLGIESYLENDDGELECPICKVNVKSGKSGVAQANVIPRAFSTNCAETPKTTPFHPTRQPISRVFLEPRQKK